MDDLQVIPDSSKVKKEIEEDDFLLGTTGSAMDQMVVQMEREDANRFETPDAPSSKPKPKRAKRSRASASEEKDDEWTPDSEPPKKETVLKTFGLSSRPRRSVNYASIERGDEETAQSLTYDMGGSSKKRTKRSRDEQDENYADDPRKNKKKPTPKSSNGVNKAVELRVLKIFETELLAKVPSWKDERPIPDARSLGSQLDNSVAIKRSSGGFRRFVGWMSDAMICKLFAFVDEHFKIGVPVDTLKKNEVLKMSRAIRHAWNSLPQPVRKQWEKSARLDCFESFKLIGAGTLPLCEFPIETLQERQKRTLSHSTKQQPTCCSGQNFSNTTDVVEHFMAAHDSVHFFGCQFCNTLFPSKGDYRVHVCDGFNAYLMKLTMNNQTIQAKAAYCALSCKDCGLWLPLRTKTLGPKCWPYYSALTIAHTCKTLVPIIVYFPEEISETKALEKMKFSILPRITSPLITSCVGCGIESFSSVNEMIEHFKTNHPELAKTCTRCGDVHAVEYSYRQHMLTHYNNSMLLGNYLKYSATYYPPPNSKRLLHYGFNKENVQVGGFDATNSPMIFTEQNSIEDIVEVNEDVLKTKLRNSMAHISNTNTSGATSSYSDFSASSSSLDSSESDFLVYQKKPKKDLPKGEPRNDLGYEHVNYDVLFTDSTIEKEAKHKLRSIFGNEDDKLFKDGEKVLEPERVLEALEGQQKSQDFELAELKNSFADDLGRRFTRVIELPISSVIDPLKDFLLFNRVYTYCSKCDQIFTGGVDAHMEKCGAETDCIVELFHPVMDQTLGVKCFDPDCDERLCSIISLRVHAATVHGIFVGFEPTALVDKRYDHSISDMSKCLPLLQSDKRSRIARFTDAEIGMPFNGLLEKNQSVTLPVNTTVQHNRSDIFQNNMKLIKPYVEPKIASYDCVWCDFNSRDSITFQLHVGRNHVFACDMCGKCFGSKGKMNLHPCTKIFKNRMMLSNDLVINGACKKCGQRLPINLLHCHVLKYHFYDVRYSQNTGEIFPEAMNLTCDARLKGGVSKPNGHVGTPAGVPEIRQADRMRIIRSDPNQFKSTIAPNANPTIPGTTIPAGGYLYAPPPRKNTDKRLTCYLCGMAYSSTSELDRHLEQHPEKWKKCPFNCHVPINGHYDMQRHLLEAHMVRHNGGMTCQFCRTPNPESPCAHLVYHCRRLPNCGICAAETGSYDSHVGHMAREHVRDLRRFQCTLCSHIFITMPEFYDHQCKISTSTHSCGCNVPTVFQSIAEYLDHYDLKHVLPNYVCGICRIPQHSYQNFAKHRLNHMHPMSSSNLRKLYLLPEWLHPKPITKPLSTFNRGQPPSHMRLPNGAAGTLVKRVGGAVVNAVPSKNQNMQQALDNLLKSSTSKPTPVSKVVTVEDIDDDDDDIVFEGSVQNTPKIVNVAKVVAGNTSPVLDDMPNLLENRGDGEGINAQVRVERHENAGNSFGQGQPGYVEEDGPNTDNQALITIEEVEMAKKNAKVVEVQDENGDDELAVVAEVENVSGVLSSTIAATSREKKFKCDKCSSAFLTNLSLVKHAETHSNDAGMNTSSETFGLPTSCNGFICRSCCLVFEDKSSFQTHVAHHGDTQLPCRKCSGIAFNSSIFHQHLKAHDSKSLYYACGSCKTRFFSDLHLMEHLSLAHGVVLFCFCKICGIGSTSMNTIFKHINSAHSTDYILSNRIGVCPSLLLNYEPRSIEAFKKQLETKAVVCIKPSDCSHRSLLLTTDPLVSCTTCHCTQSLHSFVAFNKMADVPISFSYSEPKSDLHRIFPLMSHLSEANGEYMNLYGTQVTLYTPTGIRGTLADMNHCSVKTFLKQPNSLASQLHPSASTLNAMAAPRMLNGSRIVRTVGGQQSTNNYRSESGSPEGSSGPPRVIIPRSGSIAPSVPSTATRVITNRNNILQRQQQGSPSSYTMSINENPMASAPATNLEKCTTCNALVSTEFDRLKHRMHSLTEHSWFCSICAASDKDEMGMLLHYYQAHLAPIISQKEEGFKPLTFDLKCPHADCRALQFMTLSAFTKHLNTHADMMPHNSECCESRFASRIRQDAHDEKHRLYEEENGVDGTCCPLCGTLDTWTLPKEKGRTFVLSHIARHGLDYYSTCRFCFVRFPDDTDFSQLFDHYRLKHLIERDSETKTCACGITDLNQKELHTHFKEKHALNVIRKSTCSKDGELVVRAGLQLLNFLGLRRKIVVGNRESTPIQRKRSSSGDIDIEDIPHLKREERCDNGESELKRIDEMDTNGNGVIDLD